MTYDNTKLQHAIYQWLHERCIEGFGEVYCRDLLNNFIDFIEETGMMRRSPGRVVFGRELARLGFEKRKVYGQTFWAGIRLKTQSLEQATRPQKYAKSLARKQHEEKKRKANEARRKAKYRKELAEFRARLKAEKEM